jgi:predicted PurR-regulated permease PerM
MNKKYIIDISADFLWKVFLAGVGLFVLYLARFWIAMLVLSFLLSSGVILTGKWLKAKLKIEEVVGIVLVFALLVGSVIAMGIIFIPMLLGQIEQVVQDIPGLIDRVNVIWQFMPVQDASIQDFLNRYFSNITWLDVLSVRLVDTTRSMILVIGSAGLVAVVTMYFSLAYTAFDTNIARYFPKHKRPLIKTLLSEARLRMGNWIIGQILIAVILGALSYLIMAMLSVPYALLLGALSGVLNLIPFIGPVLAIIPTTIFATTVSWEVGAFIFASQIILQQLEGNILTPLVMNKVTGLPPIVVILSVILGSAILGPLGAILAVPVMSTIIALKKKV